MPFPLIPTALAIGFLLVWVLIGGLMFRDGQLAMRRDREFDANVLPLASNRAASARSAHARRMKPDYKKSRVRAAS